MRKVVAAIALTFMAGSAGENSARAQDLLSMTDGAVRGTGAVHEVQMVLNDAGEYRYVPDELTIKVGDTVRWINASGGPHNVAFRVDGIPEGAADVLTAAMPNTFAPMSGALLMAPNAVYEIVFAGAPTGEYAYTCTPHELLGMVATLTIE